MDIREEKHGNVCVVAPRGRLDVATSPGLAERLDKLIGGSQPRLLVDFSDVEFVSSAGLRVILATMKKIKAANGSFALCGLRPPVQEVLDITGFTPLIDIHPDVSTALAAMA
jgi:anti-anti-sigma factor